MTTAHEILGPVERAAAAKVESMLRPAAEAEAFLRAQAGEAEAAQVTRAVELARRLGATVKAADAYLSHPFRVAGIVVGLAGVASEPLLLVSALHNVYEVSGATEASLGALGVPDDVARAIRLLTIDRALEADEVYLNGFYGAIEAHGRDLALVRVADKLDNVLGLDLLEDGPIKTSYVDLAERFVGPMATRLSPELGTYFASAIELARTRRCDAAKLAIYKKRLEEA